MTEALVHLLPLPKVRGILVLHFDSMAHAVASVGAILSCEPSAAELLDGLILRLAEQSLEYRNYLDFVVGQPESLVLVEFSGEHRDEVRSQGRRADRKARRAAGLVPHSAGAGKVDVRSRLGLPQGRAAAAAGSARQRASRWRSSKMAAVAPQHLPAFVERFSEIMARHGTEGAFYGHASVGCLHIRPMLDLTQRGRHRAACSRSRKRRATW